MALEVIFAYGYEYCVFKHNIYGDRPKVPEGMSDSAEPLLPEFFMNPAVPLSRRLPRPLRPKFL